MRYMRYQGHIQEHAMRTLHVQALHEYTMGIQQHAATMQGLQHVQPREAVADGTRDRQTIRQGYSATYAPTEQGNKALDIARTQRLAQ